MKRNPRALFPRPRFFSSCSLSMWLPLSRAHLIAINIGASHVALGRFSVGRAKQLRLEQLNVERFPLEDSRESQWRENVAQGLIALAARSRSAAKVSLVIPGHLAMTKLVRAPAVASDKRERILEFEAAQAIPYPLNEMIWSSAIVHREGADQEVLLAAARSDVMDELCSSAIGAGMTVTSASPAVVALHQSYRYNYPETTEPTLLIDLGARSTQLLLCEGERFVGRTLPFGCDSITQEVATALQLSFSEAEKLKIEYGGLNTKQFMHLPAWRAVRAGIEGFAAKIAGELKRSLITFQPVIAAKPISTLITGGGSRCDALAESLAPKIEGPLRIFSPVRRIQLADALTELGLLHASPQLAQLVGVATRLVVANPMTLDLVPPAQRRVVKRQAVQAGVATAGIVTALALVPPIVVNQRQAASTDRQIHEEEKRVEPLRVEQRRQRDVLKEISELDAKNRVVSELLGRKTEWQQFFRSLQSQLASVGDVWLESLAVEQTEAAGQKADIGTTPSPTRLLVSGRLLDRENPRTRVGGEAHERAKKLIAGLNQSEFVAAVERERFENSQPGLLQFDFVLVARAERLR